MSPPPARTALVTGAGRGLGAVLARALAAQGIAVGLLGRDRGALETVAADVERAGVAVADVTDEGQVRRAVGEIQDALGGVDLLVNNAGRIDPEEVPLGTADLTALWDVVEVNLRGPLIVTAAVLPGMLAAGGGRVVNVNSGFAYRRSAASTGYTGYAVSKGALARLTDLLGAQYVEGPGQAGVLAFDISPGAVATDMTAAMPMFAGRTEWTPPERMVAFVLAVAGGQLDPLAGRFLHAGQDELADLLARAERIRQADSRVLSLRTYGADDPLR